MPTQAESQRRLADLIASGGALDGFPWPETTRDYGIAIRRDGVWTHWGDPIERRSLVRLFATVLQRDAHGVYWLVTPGERGEIAVEDAPFIAVEAQRAVGADGPTLSFRTNLDHWVTADAEHPIWVTVDAESGAPTPYIRFRDGLAARLARPVYYELAEWAEEQMIDGAPMLGVESNGCFFPLEGGAP